MLVKQVEKKSFFLKFFFLMSKVKQCSHCQSVINPYKDMFEKHSECGCYSHISCLNKTKSCGVNHEKQEEKGQNIAQEEPQPSFINRWLGGMFSNALNYNKDIYSSNDPYFLLQKQCPVDILQDKGFSLSKMAEFGITIDNFIDNEYKIKDLVEFDDLNIENLVKLKVEAEDFRDHPDVLPLKVLNKKIGLTPRDIVTIFGFKFNYEGPMGCRDTDWNTKDLIALQIKGDILTKEAGLLHKHQWNALNPEPLDYRLLKIDITSLYKSKPKKKKKVATKSKQPVIKAKTRGKKIVLTPKIRNQLYK